MELRESEEIFIYPGVARARGGTSLCEMLMRDEMHNLHTFYLKLNLWMGARDVGHQSFLEFNHAQSPAAYKSCRGKPPAGHRTSARTACQPAHRGHHRHRRPQTQHLSLLR